MTRLTSKFHPDLKYLKSKNSDTSELIIDDVNFYELYYGIGLHTINIEDVFIYTSNVLNTKYVLPNLIQDGRILKFLRVDHDFEIQGNIKIDDNEIVSNIKLTSVGGLELIKAGRFIILNRVCEVEF